jgi:hypothetical protein
MTYPKYLRRKQASQYLQEVWGIRCGHNTLAKLAVVGGGPRFHKAGRDPLYTPADLDAYAQAKISGPMSSTAELSAA